MPAKKTKPLQLPALRVLSEVLIPARSFDDLDTESQFLREFRATGRTAASCGFAAGAVISFMGFALFQSGVSGYSSGQIPQVIRVLNLLLLSGLIIFLTSAPVLSLKYYRLAVGTGVFFAMWSLGFVTLLAAIENPEHRGKFLVAMVIGILIVYSFMRLPVGLAATACLSSGVPVYFATLRTEAGQQFGVLMYLFVANAVGWILCIQIERRERRVFVQTKELKALSEQLELRLSLIQKATVARDRMLHGVAHDLRQPLVSLDLYIAQLSANGPNGLALLQSVQYERIRSCIGVMHAGIADLLKESGLIGSELLFDRFNVYDLIEDVLRVVDVQATVKNVRISLRKSSSSSLIVESNFNALRGIFLNLIGNAIKFHDCGDYKEHRVFVCVLKFSTSIRVDIFDNGVGICADDLQHIFDPYWRGEGTDRSGAAGLGLGLYVVRDLIDRLPGHHIKVDSIVGTGTRVRIRFPIS